MFWHTFRIGKLGDGATLSICVDTLFFATRIFDLGEEEDDDVDVDDDDDDDQGDGDGGSGDGQHLPWGSNV